MHMKNKIKKLISIPDKIIRILSLPKTLLWNLRIFPISKAIKLPIIINYRTKVDVQKGGIITSGNRVWYGFGGAQGISSNSEMFLIVKKGKIEFKGSAKFAKGTSIRLLEEGKVTFGTKFEAGKNFRILGRDNICFGDSCLIASNVEIRDNDGHFINGEIRKGSIAIGTNCWLGDNCLILKNVNIGDGCVIGTRSMVTSSISKNTIPESSVIAGSPAKILKQNIVWNK